MVVSLQPVFFQNSFEFVIAVSFAVIFVNCRSILYP